MSKAKHQDDIITGVFSDTMMKDWDNDVLWLQDIGEWWKMMENALTEQKIVKRPWKIQSTVFLRAPEQAFLDIPGYQSLAVPGFFQVSHQLPEMSSGCQLAEVETRDCRDWLWEDTCRKHADQGRVLLCSDWKQTKERTRCIKIIKMQCHGHWHCSLLHNADSYQLGACWWTVPRILSSAGTGILWQCNPHGGHD